MPKSLKPNKFIAKLYAILQLSQNESCICWNTQGTQIIISDAQRFAQTVIPQNFRLKKFKSFVRQLHIYDFRKINGGKNHMTFFNNQFVRGQSQQLPLIKRKRLTKKQRQKKKEQQQIKKLNQEFQRIKELNSQSEENFDENNSANLFYLCNNFQGYNISIKSQSQFFFQTSSKEAKDQLICNFNDSNCLTQRNDMYMHNK